jgi:Mor family transcriptional regulator
MYLTEGSAVALLYTHILYLEHNGIDVNELFKKYILDDQEIKYEFSPKD